MSFTFRAGLVALCLVVATGGVAFAQTERGSKPSGGVGVAAPGDATLYVPITPCRVVDTRSGGGGVLRPGNVRSYQVYGSGFRFALQGGRAGGCGIPADALAFEGTVTAVSPGADGFVRAWPTGLPEPNATFLNYTRNQNISNTGAITLSEEFELDLTMRNYGGTTHLVVDVQGYFVNIGPI